MPFLNEQRVWDKHLLRGLDLLSLWSLGGLLALVLLASSSSRANSFSCSSPERFMKSLQHWGRHTDRHGTIKHTNIQNTPIPTDTLRSSSSDIFLHLPMHTQWNVLQHSVWQSPDILPTKKLHKDYAHLFSWIAFEPFKLLTIQGFKYFLLSFLGPDWHLTNS